MSFELTGCPCGCGHALCPRCYGDFVNTCDGILGAIMGVLWCHDCRMAFLPGEINAMIRGEYNGQMKLDAETIERRVKNRERLRPFGFNFDGIQEQRESMEVGRS